MGNMDFGKGLFLGIVFIVVLFFVGTKAYDWYQHQNDLPFNLEHITYTKTLYDDMESDEQKLLNSEIKNLCIRKHYADGLDCTETSYWFANGLEERGVDGDLAMDWMPICVEACSTAKAPPPVPLEESKAQTKQSPRTTKEYGGATKWFWEN